MNTRNPQVLCHGPLSIGLSGSRHPLQLQKLGLSRYLREREKTAAKAHWKPVVRSSEKTYEQCEPVPQWSGSGLPLSTLELLK